MPKTTKSSAQESNQTPPPEELVPSSQDEISTSDHKPDPEITFQPPRQLQPVPRMFIPYIEGPEMDWTVNAGLYYRFLKWHLKCESI